MNFAEAAKEKEAFTTTENGAIAKNTSGSKLLDLFSTIGSLREAEVFRIERLFADAYAEDPLMATKIVFYGRDIREGLGERQIFRILIRYMAQYHPESLKNNIKIIGEYGRYDDLYSFINTPLENEMWKVMKEQLAEDIKHLNNNEPVSLLAKWIKTADASSDETRKLGILTARKLGYKVYNFKRIIRSLRKKINVTESLMSTNKWNEIEYSEVPSKAMSNYREAFLKHDSDRFSEFINKALTGEEKINSSTLYPYDIMEKVMYDSSFSFGRTRFHVDDVLEAQWRQLPNYIEPGTNAIVMADVSGSMYGRPLATSIGLAVYFAERNYGAYHNLWMTFSANPKFQYLKGETLVQKLSSMDMDDWDMNTDLKAAFDLVLDVALESKVSPEEMPKSIIVISDMEIDRCGNREWTFYDKMEHKFEKHGYTIPNIVFWNVNSRHNVFHADATRKGVQLVSGQSITTFKQVINSIGMTPLEMMYSVIDSDRYAPITIA